MRTESEAVALIERGECVRYRTDERGAVRLAARSLCVAAVTLGACTPTGRDDMLAVDPVDDIDVVTLVDHDLPGVESIERFTREIGVRGHVGCDDGVCTMGGMLALESVDFTTGVPASVVVATDLPPVRTSAPRPMPLPTERSRATKRALRRDRWELERLHRAAKRADRKARRAARRFARAHRFVAKLKQRRARWMARRLTQR